MKRLISFLLWCALCPAPSFGNDTSHLEILSDTNGVDFVSYLKSVESGVQEKWYAAIPPSKQTSQGNVDIEFSIAKDGKITGTKFVRRSGDELLDRAAWVGIAAASPFPPLPADFKGPSLALRFHFDYNPSSAPSPGWDEGEVVGRTYKNASLGIELTPPATLKFGDPELKGTPGTLPLLVTISARGKSEWASVRKVMAFYAEALAYDPSTPQSTEVYMRKVMRNQQNDGYESIEAAPYETLSGVTFARHDFRKGGVYESVLVKVCGAHSLVFIFAGAGEEIVDGMGAETKLKFDSANSGCFPKSATAPDKESAR